MSISISFDMRTISRLTDQDDIRPPRRYDQDNIRPPDDI